MTTGRINQISNRLEAEPHRWGAGGAPDSQMHRTPAFRRHREGEDGRARTGTEARIVCALLRDPRNKPAFSLGEPARSSSGERGTRGG